MKVLLKISLVVALFTSALFGADMAGTLEKAYEFLDDGVVKSIATLLIVAAGLTIASGQFEKGKVYLWAVVIGISLVYGAKTIAEALF